MRCEVESGRPLLLVVERHVVDDMDVYVFSFTVLGKNRRIQSFDIDIKLAKGNTALNCEIDDGTLCRSEAKRKIE